MSRPPAPQKAYAVPYSPVGSRLDEHELDVIRTVVTSGETLSRGIWRDRFEDAFQTHVGTNHAYSVTSGTVSVELAIHLLGLAPGDEVIVTPQTYQATVQPLLDHPVRVRFADVSPDTLNIDPQRVGDLVTEHTRAIILVHYGGRPADMDEIMKIASDHDLLVVEDAAHALGGGYDGRRPGGLGHIGCFSFHSSKNITTLGEGGMLTFDRADWAERLDRIRDNESDAVFVPAGHRFGDSVAPPRGALYPGRAYTHDCAHVHRAGTNATLSEAAAAVGLLQLEKLPQLVRRRQEIAAYLADTLSAFEDVRVPAVPAHIVHAQHLFTCFMQRGPAARDDLVRRLAEGGVQTYLRYFPLHLLPEWRARGHGLGECPVAESVWFEQQVNLPCHPSLSDGQVELMAAVLERSLSGAPAGG
jgi:perosamine synthetase